MGYPFNIFNIIFVHIQYNHKEKNLQQNLRFFIIKTLQKESFAV